MRISDWSSDVCSSDLKCVWRAPRRADSRRSADFGEGTYMEGAHAGYLRRRGREAETLIGQRAQVRHMLANRDAGAKQHAVDRAGAGMRVVDIVAVDADQPRPALDQQPSGGRGQERMVFEKIGRAHV